MFALVAGVPEAGEASGAAFAQDDPSWPVIVDPNPQGVVDRELMSGADLVPGGPPLTVYLYSLFHATRLSPDSAHWSAQSSDTGVVTVGFNMGVPRYPVGTPHVWIRPVGTGEATITVGYTGFGNSVSTRFTVRVVARAPVDGGDDPPDTFDPVAQPHPQVRADRYFSRLTVGGRPAIGWARDFIAANEQMADYSAYWSAQSSDTGVVTVSLARKRVPDAGFPPNRRTPLLFWLWPVGEGEASVTVGYSRHGKSATTKFTVRVGAAGEDDGEDDGVGPVANVQEVVNDEVEQAGGLESGGGAVPIDVNKLFSNVGSGATGRDFDARSSDGRVVTVEVTDNPHVVIRPVGDGTATVTVRYTGGGRSVSAVFGVAVGEGFRAPVPALPLAAAGLLAALVFGAGLRRRRGRP